MHAGGTTPGGKIRWMCRNSTRANRNSVCYSTTDPSKPARDRGGHPIPEMKFDRKVEPVSRYLITAAQNSTPVHRKFFASLLRAKRSLKAELLIVPIRYRNPTSVFSDRKEEWWDKKVQRYLYNGRLRLNSNLTLLGDVKTQPTASEPLRGFESITHGESCILAHTKLSMKVVAAPANRFPKILHTTGACTVPNYTDSKAGALGKFHHAQAAILVEVQGKKFHIRQLNAGSNGEFTDLTKRYTPAGIRKAPRPSALIMGDTHVDFIDKTVEQVTFGKGGIIDVLNPEALIWHDVLDGYSVNPHHQGNPWLAEAKMRQGLGDVREEIARAVKFVCDRTTGDRLSFIVPSNHNDFVDRYMNKVDWKEDLVNARFYFETGSHLLNNSGIGPSGFEMPSPFEFWFSKFSSSKQVRVLRASASLLRCGVELAMHGDVGPSGSRGSAHNLKRIGVRSVIGHSHTPCIAEGCYQVGTSTALRLEYNKGPGSWLNTHCVLHADGKRQLITIIDGDWRI